MTDRTQLRASVAAGDGAAAAASCARRVAGGESPAVVAGDLLWIAADAGGDWPRVTVMAAEALRAAGGLQKSHRGLPLAQVAAVAASVLRVQPMATARPPATEQAPATTLLAEIDTVAELRAGWMPIALALVELDELCGPAAVAPLVARTRAGLLVEPTAQLGALREHCERLALLDGQWQRIFEAADPTKLEKFQEPKFRRHLLDGRAEAAFRALAKAAAYGIPRQAIAGSIGLAAAERVLRFDASLANSPRAEDSWADVLQAFELAAATLRALRRRDEPQWLRFALTAAWLVNARAAADAPEALRYALPQPEALPQTWDHGPEIAKVHSRLLAADTDGAIAALRGYLLMVLPVQPLTQRLAAAGFEDVAVGPRAQALVSAALAAGIEIFSSLADHPHRELALCAALRLATAPLCPSKPHAEGLAAIELLEGAPPPARRAPNLWTCPT